MTNKSDGSTAANILRAAIGHMDQRAATYDKPEGERSMGSTVLAFAAITGVLMTEEQGWLFMALLKAVRSQQGACRADSYEDGAAYFALAGEAAVRDRNGGWTSEAIKAAALHPMPANFGQQHTIEPASLIDDESPRMQAIGQNGPSAEHYAELDRLQDAADFNDDVPISMREAVELGARPVGNCTACLTFAMACTGACVPAKEPHQPRHRCLACAGGHATHECGAGR